ncbi:zinc ribbon domain-containing protein [Lactobacillus johnsonii]|uniref:zinc-ribbon domain-containing protein n=1 Tax=Lactobacillus johnsonii TaxID=33959 RepID=UPI00262B46CD
MKKKFCPNCGQPLKADSVFCPNCGFNVHSKTPKSDQRINHTQRVQQISKKRKSKLGIVIASCILLLLVGGITGFYFYNQHHDQAAVIAHSKKGTKKQNLRVKKNKNNADKNKNSQKKDYSNAIWMLMGYMAYARKNYEDGQNVTSTSELVDAVVKDFKDDTLTATKKSSTTYNVSNNYGDVDVEVKPSEVKVTNDGTTVTPKSELKETFNKYTTKISPVVKKIVGETDDGVKATTNKNSKSSKADGAFSNEEMVVAAYLDEFSGNTTKDKINNIKAILEKDNSDVSKIPTDDYISGLYSHTYKGKPYYSIASNVATSHYKIVYLNGDSDQYTTQIVAPGISIDEDTYKKNKSKKDLINNLRPYKQEIDKILNQIKDNKNRLPSIIEEQAKQGEKASQSESNKNDSDNDNTDDSSDEPEDTNDTDEDTDADY